MGSGPGDSRAEGWPRKGQGDQVLAAAEEVPEGELSGTGSIQLVLQKI